MESQLAWLEYQDIQERAQWVPAFRDSDKTLGTVIKEIMQQRDAHWSANKSQGPPPDEAHARTA